VWLAGNFEVFVFGEGESEDAWRCGDIALDVVDSKQRAVPPARFHQDEVDL
jgi:hypothetical protein